ncbi:Alpha crystallin/Hsp20 domain-containing protein [Cinnamomum micranthum f. kanehirae]|uniref:Alpha crystallin/Hsp20 domain-containing protein n=1 Tax=Cinnamomum micranthum f. kanehirae TaxID=337451 RepID=A0A3S4Q0X7_9MAGN|nr:Alpha crystallin/Hsp20 domain-containing protein [Cinnamomum micranthum f. kanehirae]
MSLIPSFFGRRSNVFDPFSLDIWDPFQDFPFRSSNLQSETSALANARIDWKETPDAHVFKADLPGLNKEEVKVELEEEGRVLQISGERCREQEEKNDKWHRVERSRGKFLRRFRLPENAKVDEVKAAMENGVLTVTVPKEQVKKPDKEEVKVELEEGRVLQISGERSREQEEKNDKWHRVERSSGKFLRRFRLPENAKVDEVKAAMENGVLTVTVPKEQMSLIPSFFGRRSNVFDPFSLDIWDPFQDFPSGLTSSNLRSETSALANARIDWKETPEAHVFKADLPGLKKEEVKVELEEGRVLQISGERSREQEEKNDKWHRVERSSGRFLRRFRLPENAKVDEVKAAMENGVLTVTVPKEQVKKPDVKAIDISA